MAPIKDAITPWPPEDREVEEKVGDVTMITTRRMECPEQEAEEVLAERPVANLQGTDQEDRV